MFHRYKRKPRQAPVWFKRDSKQACYPIRNSTPLAFAEFAGLLSPGYSTSAIALRKSVIRQFTNQEASLSIKVASSLQVPPSAINVDDTYYRLRYEPVEFF